MNTLTVLTDEPRDPGTVGPQGDVIPLFHDGWFHVYYLQSPVGVEEMPARVRTSWAHRRSRDLVHWLVEPYALEPGSPGAPDADGVWTGSVIVHDGVFHAFYTGYDAARPTPQTVCHATSDDGVHFVKDDGNPILAPPDGAFASQDWRDPFVYRDEERSAFVMLVTARATDGPSRRRGVVARATSPDLRHWTLDRQPAFAPQVTYALECPEVFELGARRWLAYSRFSEDPSTVFSRIAGRGRRSRLVGQNRLDGARWYAAKSAADDEGRRISFGWCGDRQGLRDDGAWLWGGDLCLPRELVATDRGMTVRLPSEILAAFGTSQPVRLTPAGGRWSGGETGMVAHAAAGSSYADIRDLPAARSAPVMIEIVAAHPARRGRLGFVVDGSADITDGTAFVYLLDGDRLVLESWPASAEEAIPSPSAAVHAPPRRRSGDVVLRAVVRDHLVEVFANDSVALTHQMYARPSRFSVIVEGADLELTVSCRTP